MVCPTTAFAAWDSTNLCVVLSFIGGISMIVNRLGQANNEYMNNFIEEENKK